MAAEPEYIAYHIIYNDSSYIKNKKITNLASYVELNKQGIYKKIKLNRSNLKKDIYRNLKINLKNINDYQEFINDFKVGNKLSSKIYVVSVKGSIKIKTPTKTIKNISPGMELFPEYKIITDKYGKITFTLDEDIYNIILYNESNIQLKEESNQNYILLNHGSIFLENFVKIENRLIVKTNYTSISNLYGQILIHSNLYSNDKIYLINGEAKVTHSNGDSEHLQVAENTYQNTITKGLNKKLINPKKKQLNLLVKSGFSSYGIIRESIGNKQKIEPMNFGALSISPQYKNKNLFIKYDFDWFIGLNEKNSINNLMEENFNNYSDINRLLSALTLKFRTSNDNLLFQLKRIENLTIGYGSLMNQYTNSIHQPLKQNPGFLLKTKSNSNKYTFDIFISSIHKPNSSLIGFYTSGKILKNIPLTIGFATIIDNNQFSEYHDTLWTNVEPKKNRLQAYQIDLTYNLVNTLDKKMNLFSEFSIINFGDELRYFKLEDLNGEIIDRGFDKKFAFSLLGPGVNYKLGHHKNIIIAFNYSSPLFTTPFFSETYELERIHYTLKTEIDSIIDFTPYEGDKKWFEMITQYHNDTDSSIYYLPKQINRLLDPTHNVYNKCGISTSFKNQFREKYSYTLDMNIYKEIGSQFATNTFYTTIIKFDINEGVLNNISKLRLYYGEYFTNELFSSHTDSESKIMGFQLEYNITSLISISMYQNSIFYDHDFDGKTDIISTNKINLIMDF